MSNAEFLFILFIVTTGFQIHLFSCQTHIPPETCYEVTLNVTSYYHSENKQPKNIGNVEIILGTDFDLDNRITCRNANINLTNNTFRNNRTLNITLLSLTYRIVPLGNMEKVEAYFCGENALQRASQNATQLKKILAFSEKTKSGLAFEIEQRSCCKEQNIHFEPCCKKGYTLKNETCVRANNEKDREVVKLESKKNKTCSTILSLGLIIIVASASLVMIVALILASINVWKHQSQPETQENDVEGTQENDVETTPIATNAEETAEPNIDHERRPTDNTVSVYLKMSAGTHSFSTTQTESTTCSRASSVNHTDKRPKSHSELLFDFDKNIPMDAIKFTGALLGRGQFGRVELANVTLNGTTKKCAVKMIRGRGTNEDEKELFHELEMLYQIPDNPYVVNLLGGCMDPDSPLYVVVEYCSKGNLLNYLQKNKQCQEYVNVTSPLLSLRWKINRTLEICKGMIFLSNNQIIHRDLAARNILLDDNDVAKISDFGMAKDVYLRGLYIKETAGFLPVRWMAIEAIESSMYTIKSDMWSFGILLWELYMDGKLPYPAIPDATKLLDYLKNGYRMAKPENCPDTLYQLMERCWLSKPDDRPAFSQALRELKSINRAETTRESQGSDDSVFSDELQILEEPEEPHEINSDITLTDAIGAVGFVNYGRSSNGDIELSEMKNPNVETTVL